MLPKKNRMVKAQDFSHALRHGVRGGNKFLVLFVVAPDVEAAANTNSDNLTWANGEQRKIGFIVPKRQIPLAVDRNRMRRRLRHLIAARLLDFPPGTKMVIRVMSPSVSLDGKQLEETLDRAIRSIKKKQVGTWS